MPDPHTPLAATDDKLNRHLRMADRAIATGDVRTASQRLRKTAAVINTHLDSPTAPIPTPARAGITPETLTIIQRLRDTYDAAAGSIGPDAVHRDWDPRRPLTITPSHLAQAGAAVTAHHPCAISRGTSGYKPACQAADNNTREPGF